MRQSLVTAPPTRLEVLLHERHWQEHNDFRREYDKAAQRIERSLVGYGPGRTQFYCWLSGNVKGLRTLWGAISRPGL